MVHPDFFTAQPEKRKINSESFALLQNYLDTIKEFKISEDGGSKPFTLKFYTVNRHKKYHLKQVGIYCYL